MIGWPLWRRLRLFRLMLLASGEEELGNLIGRVREIFEAYHADVDDVFVGGCLFGVGFGALPRGGFCSCVVGGLHFVSHGCCHELGGTDVVKLHCFRDWCFCAAFVDFYGLCLFNLCFMASSSPS